MYTHTQAHLDIFEMSVEVRSKFTVSAHLQPQEEIGNGRRLAAIDH